jgi:hypothetical protein
MLAVKIVPARAVWIVSGVAVWMLLLAHLPSANAAGSVPVVRSTATPAPCVGNCHRVQPDVIALLDPHLPPGATPAPMGAVIFAPKATLVFWRVVRFPHELDIGLTASDGTHETIHLPFSVRPSSSSLRFPQAARLDSVIGLRATARILYHQGTRGSFKIYTVSEAPFMTEP